MLLFSGLVAYQASKGYHKALQDSEQVAARLNRIIAEHTELTFLGADLALRRAIERQYFNDVFGNKLPSYLQENFNAWLTEMPQIATLALIGSDGRARVTANKPGYDDWLDYSQSLLGNALFKQMQNVDSRHVFIGMHETQNGDLLLIMSRRYTKPNGTFGGIAIATINLKRWHHPHRRPKHPPQ